MISLLRNCQVYVDNGDYYSDDLDCYRAKWEREYFSAGEEIDETDPMINIINLTHGEDFVRL